MSESRMVFSRLGDWQSAISRSQAHVGSRVISNWDSLLQIRPEVIMSWPAQRGVVDVAERPDFPRRQGEECRNVGCKVPAGNSGDVRNRWKGSLRQRPASTQRLVEGTSAVGERTRPVTSLSTPGAPCGSSCVLLRPYSPSIRGTGLLPGTWRRISLGGMLAPSCQFVVAAAGPRGACVMDMVGFLASFLVHRPESTP
jgi:hypothetical protein